MNILITGVHGFVGSNLVKTLSINNTVYGLDIVSPEKNGVHKTFRWDDLDTEGTMPPIDAIIHLAGKAHDVKNITLSEVYFNVNTVLTKKIFDWYMANPTIKSFVFFSTAKAAAESVCEILHEDVVPTPKGPYGESKILAENYIISKLEESGSSRKLMSSIIPDSNANVAGKNVYIFRPCMIHGPGNKGNLNLLYKVVKMGFPWPLGAFENHRTFASVENICYAVESVLTKDVPSGIYNMADDESLSTNELIELICLVLGKKSRIWRIPKGFMNDCAKIGGWLHLPFDSLRMQKLTENYVVSNAKIKAALGIDKMPVRAKDGLITTIESFLKKK